MGTFSKTYINFKDINVVIQELKKFYKIGQEEWHNDSKDWLFNLPPSSNITLIISKNFNIDWIEIEFNFGNNLYIYDEFLRRLSNTLRTKILLGYYQSTTGDGRLAKFKDGQLELSYYEQWFYYKFNGDDSPPIDRIYVADNWGILNSNFDKLKSLKLGKDSSLIDYDFIYEYFESEGLEGDSHKDFTDWTYLHLEQIIK